MKMFLSVPRMSPNARKKKSRRNVRTAIMVLMGLAITLVLCYWVGTQLSTVRPTPSPTSTPIYTTPPPPYTEPAVGFTLLSTQILGSGQQLTPVNYQLAINQPAQQRIPVTLTAYCSCSKCCGKWAEYGITASGTIPQANHTIAHETLPFGTRVMINQTVYTVEDRGVFGDSVDIFFDTHSQAQAFGKQQDVMIVLPE